MGQKARYLSWVETAPADHAGFQARSAPASSTGTADAGFLPFSLARSPALAGGRTWAVTPDLYPPLEQAGVVLTGASNPDVAATFRAFLTGSDGRAILARHGFDPPPE